MSRNTHPHWREPLAHALTVITEKGAAVDPKTKARRVAKILDRHYVPEAVTLILCLGLGALALDLFTAPETYYRPTFHVAMEWASPQVWGVTLLMPVLATMAALAARRRDLFWPLTAMLLWVTTWSTAVHLSAADPDAVRSAAIIYTTVSLVTALMALVYMRESREQ